VTTFIRDLAEVVFVQQVEASALAAVVPVLVKGLRSRIMKTQRQTCVIAANMCRLVSSVADVHAVAPQLLPLLKRVSEDAADPDVRAVAGRAYASLENVAEVDMAGQVREELRAFLMDAVSAECDAERRHVFTPCPAHVRVAAVDYILILSMGLARICKNQQEEWHKRLVPLLEPLLGSGDVAKLVDCVHEIAANLTSADDDAQEDECLLGDGDDDGLGNGEHLGVLCDCSLTLACGAATLLAGARLRLARGQVYGLIGANDSGKSTLLRALHDRRVVGFPDASQLVTALVEHGVGEHPPACDQLPLDYLLADPALQACGLSKEKL
jgi:elongation factor 3